MIVVRVEKLRPKSCAISLIAQLSDTIMEASSTKPTWLVTKAWTVASATPWCTRVIYFIFPSNA